ncbi:MAG TPA: hypothetical protein VNI54_18545 [Thermoanaerobaculia bacterium]|nr:hypothetical protein [Thermoanaerobaculia bacterium]
MKKLALLVLLTAAAHGQISPRPPDAVVPVVGSTRGQSNANFKTELQLANPTDAIMEGWLYLRPHDLVLRYSLEPHTTRAFADVVAEMGGSGLGSLDVLIERGERPVVVARAFDDQPTGTTGANVPAVPAAAVLARTDAAALIAPRDLTRFRFNIGVRALDSGATINLTVRSSSGAQRTFRTLTYPAHQFEQQPANTFAGITLEPNDAIEIEVAAGSAIVYGSMVDNVTNDSSLQVLRK